jgi:carbamoyl-phosphate synthase large subunit
VSLTVLVLGVGGNVSQGILKALAIAGLRCRVLAACVTAEAAGLYLADEALVSPYADDPGFVGWVTEVCARERVDAVLSGVEPVLAALAPAASEILEATGAVCVVSPPEVLAVGNDKLLTCRWLEQHELPHPRYADAADAAALEALVGECGYPLLAKPRAGRGSRGIFEVIDVEAVAGREELVVQELLDGDEYTVGCFCDDAGRVRGSVAMRRELDSGTTVRAELGDFAAQRELSERIAAELGPLGPCNVQLRESSRGPIPFELNVRFSGTTPMRARWGFNEVEAALRHYVLGEPATDLPRPTAGLVLRYWNEVYVSPDAAVELARDRALSHPHGTIEDWGA